VESTCQLFESIFHTIHQTVDVARVLVTNKEAGTMKTASIMRQERQENKRDE